MKNYDSIDELAPWCALNRIFGFSPKTGLDVIRHFGSASAVFKAGRKELTEAFGVGSRYIGMISDNALQRSADELEALWRAGSRFLCIGDSRYPAALKECDDPPIGLYIKGKDAPETIFGNRPAVAIIGTRDITSYGREWCTRLVSALGRARIKPVIISGLAIGTDATAHIAALENGLPTIAVMATGTDTVYPFRHGFLADRICEADESGLVSDYPPGTSPKAINFLRRNRIIAGLSKAAILIESRIKGGGMMTCRLAYSYNRDIYALPGRIDDTFSAGCNELLRAKLAEPITDIDLFIETLGLGIGDGSIPKDIRAFIRETYRNRRTAEETRDIADVAELIKRNRDIRADDICMLTGMEYRKVASILGTLECDGIISSDLTGGCSINPKII